MKNILYIGPYKDTNGIGYAARRYIDCLANNSNINLAIRPLFATTSHTNNPIDLKKYSEYEGYSLSYYDAVIQHGYPEMFAYDSRFGKNIGIVELETQTAYRSGWSNYLNIMDEVCVNSINGLNALQDMGIQVPVKLLPEPYDIKKYQENTQPFFKNMDDKPFIFYIIGQYTEKKNIKSIILAYLLEFNKQDNVRLFIKTDLYNTNKENLNEYIEFDISQIKKALRKKEYCDIDIISGYLSDNDIIRLHQSADCYVNACRADGFGPCAVEALLTNKVVINTKNIGSSTYFHSGNALMVDAIESNVYSPTTLHNNLFTIHDKWHEPNIVSIQQQMRAAYDMTANSKNQLLNNYNKSYFDIESIKDKIV